MIPTTARIQTTSVAAQVSAPLPPVVSTRYASVQQRKLEKAAAEFESILISTFWKSMKDSFSDGNEDVTDPAHSSLDDMSIQAMAGAMSKAGGLGLGKLILRHLEPLTGKDKVAGGDRPG